VEVGSYRTAGVFLAKGRAPANLCILSGKVSMQDQESNGDTQSFIVRIWHEAVAGDGKNKTWRGSILHVGSGKRIYFHNLDSIKRFVRERTGMEKGDLPVWLQSVINRMKLK
jgi:hypothetical protein